jgi:hypothetical protein
MEPECCVVVLWISPGLTRPKTLIPVDFGTKSIYEHAHMVKINSSYVEILQSSTTFLQSSHNSVYEEFSETTGIVTLYIICYVF